MINWDLYPKSGRTQWFAAVDADRPCGIGYGYSVVTTGATGNYAQFNIPWTLITTKGTAELAQRWESATIPPAFSTPIALTRDMFPPPSDMLWHLLVDRTNPNKSMFTATTQTKPNLRTRWTIPPMQDALSNPVAECPNLWTVTPLTYRQVMSP